MGDEQEYLVQIGHPNEGVSFFKDGNQHEAYGSKWVKLTFVLK
jgi:hypothetical protein